MSALIHDNIVQGINMSQYGLPLDVYDNNGLTPFHHALIKEGCLDLARYMIGEKPDLLHQKVFVFKMAFISEL